MSKKRKVPNPINATSQVVKPSKTQSNSIPVESTPTIPTAIDESDRPFELIRFDKRVKWSIGLCIGLFLVLTLAKINYSSIGMWNTIMPDGSDAKRGIISGNPKPIRMDEWAILAPFMLSQANQGFPLENPAIGGEKVALVGYFPINHFISFFRPDYWGFYLFDVDHGFAWRWNFILCFGLISVMLAFMLLTRNQFWLSVLGAIWLIFSPGLAWWSFFLLTSIYSGFGMLIASAYMFFATKTRTILIAGILFFWCFSMFALTLYPPYQVPLGYLLVFLLVGYTWQHFNKELLFSKIWLKLGVFAVAFASMGFIFYMYYLDAKSTIDVMSNTVYPGKRSETGGTGFVANWFSEYYAGWLLSDQKFPQTWLNICELSHFITFTPVIAVSTLIYFIRTKKIDPLLAIILGYVLVLLIWIEIGFPAFLAKATLLDVSPTRRTQIPFGIANVVLAVLYMGYIHAKKIKVEGSLVAALSVAVIGFMVYAAWLNLDDAQGVYKSYQLFLPTLFFIVLNWLLLPVVNFPSKEIAVVGAVVFFTLPNLKINPVGKGMTPITDNALYKKVREIHLQEPEARWVVLGNQYITYIVTATGVNQLSGVKNQPDFKTMRVLDPTAKRDSAYNRYAHAIYNTYIDPVHPDTVIMQSNFEDGYQVALDPCSPKLRKLNVRYIIFDRTPQPVEIRCMKQVAKMGNLEIYRTND
ncbi:hypothetical protein GCM10028806_46390 [Spirosoma terrae]|uniref:glucosyltransferase domain-containing protein n=1 Tax=Spirosoma terrae TaxID=1968276 RepID=UPI001FEA6AA4|nr:glucosyltransferase domain-containing protein [Spirosoma terrae]